MVGTGSVALHEPWFAGNEWTYLKECLDSTFVSSVGKFVDRFEADLAAYTGARHAHRSGQRDSCAARRAAAGRRTAATTKCWFRRSLSLQLPTPSPTAARSPHFVDSEARTLGLDRRALRAYLQDDRARSVRVTASTGAADGVIRALRTDARVRAPHGHRGDPHCRRPV